MKHQYVDGDNNDELFLFPVYKWHIIRRRAVADKLAADEAGQPDLAVSRRSHNAHKISN